MSEVNCLLKTLMFLWLFLIVFWLFLTNLFSVIVTSLLWVILSVAGTFVLFRVKFPRPSDAVLNHILGPNPLEDQYDSYNYNGSFVTTVAHRGACIDAPENSLLAFEMCAEKNCKIVEFDVTKTADGVPIVFHDNSIDRLTGQKGIIEDILWSEVSGLDISINHPLSEKLPKTFISKLDDVVATCIQCNLRMVFDVKSDDPIVIDAICDQFKKHSLFSKAFVTSFYPIIIYKIRKINPEIVCAMTWRPSFYSSSMFCFDINSVPLVATQPIIFKRFWNMALDAFQKFAIWNFLYYYLGVRILLLHKEVINGNVVYDWHQKGVRILAWTVNSSVEKQYFSKKLKITYLTDTLVGENKI